MMWCVKAVEYRILLGVDSVSCLEVVFEFRGMIMEILAVLCLNWEK